MTDINTNQNNNMNNPPQGQDPNLYVGDNTQVPQYDGNWQQDPYQQPMIPQNQQQNIVSPSSPEQPSRLEQQEGIIYPESVGSQEQGKEKTEKKVVESKGETVKQSESKPQLSNENTKFENPYKVYGYQVSQQMAAQGKNANKSKKSDVNSAQAWLLVLLEKLLKVYKGGDYKTS